MGSDSKGLIAPPAFLFADPAGYPGDVQGLLSTRVAMHVGVKTVAYSLREAFDVNPVLPEAYGMARGKITSRRPRSHSFQEYGLDERGRLLVRRIVAAGLPDVTLTVMWQPHRVVATETRGGEVVSAWLGELVDEKLSWLMSSSASGTSWFRFHYPSREAVIAVRKLNHARDGELFFCEMDESGKPQNIECEPWCLAQGQTRRLSPRRTVFTAKAARDLAPPGTLEELRRQLDAIAIGMSRDEALLIVIDPEEPAFPPVAHILHRSAIESPSSMRDSIADERSRRIELSTALGGPDLDILNRSRKAHDEVRRLSNIALKSLAEGLPLGPILAVTDFEVSRVDWVRGP